MIFLILYHSSLLFNLKIFNPEMGKYRIDWLNEDEDNYYEPTVQKIKKHNSNPNKKHKKDKHLKED